jgi:monoamine oxidase
MIKTDILIIGGGLTGLTLAYLLRNTGRKVIVVEARDRIGGRILTIGGQDQATVEMGATWLSQAHSNLKALLNELGLNTFQQKLGSKAIYEPTSMSPHQLVTLPKQQQASYRIEGGTSALINTLASYLDDELLVVGEQVNKIISRVNKMLVKSSNTIFEADQVVSTLPPKLLAEKIEIEPKLPDNILKVLSGTHTWMGESIKFGFTFNEPFWLEKDTSGTVFSNVGPVNEMYDHTTSDGNRHAIKGFLNGSYFSISKDERLNMILEQLRKYYGTVVNNYQEYFEMVWTNEPFTFTPYSNHVLPHQNNGHKIFREPYLDDKLFIAGAETSEIAPGYMEGAIHSAYHIFDKIKSSD